MDKIIYVICGPTASGKTKYAINLARKIGGEIISADSMQIYKYMNIGTAKPTLEEQNKVKHYLIDEIDPRVSFSVAEYQKIAKNYINEVFEKGKIPIISGGTGLYINSLIYEMDFSNSKINDVIRKRLYEEANLYGNQYLHNKLNEIDPTLASRIHINNTKKMVRALEVYETTGKVIDSFEKSFVKTNEYETKIYGLLWPRDLLYERINKRVDILVKNGLFGEVNNLITMGLTKEDIAMKGIGYQEIFMFNEGIYDKQMAIQKIKQHTRNYAKRQLTWFNRYEDISWISCS